MIVAKIKDRGFHAIEGFWGGEKYFYIFRDGVFFGYIDASIKSEELDRLLTEYALKTFQ